MKTQIISLAAFLIFFGTIIMKGNAANTGDNPPSKGAVNVYASPELVNLTSAWAAEFNKTAPDARINVVRSVSNDIGKVSGSPENISVVAGSDQTGEVKEGGFEILVGREIIVPVINIKNPMLAEIFRKGISRDAIVKSLESGNAINWGTLLKSDAKTPVNYFIANDELTKSRIASFLKTEAETPGQMKSLDRVQFIQSISNDPNAIGFCRLSDILEPGSMKIMQNLQLLPIDKNGNGKLDYMENIYGNLADFTHGVWIGKYPASLTSSIRLVSAIRPEGKSEVAFIQWILTSGQGTLRDNGFCDLAGSEKQSQMDKLIAAPVKPLTDERSNSLARIILFIVASRIMVSFLGDYLIRRYRKSSEGGMAAKGSFSAFDEEKVNVPGGVYFDKTHTWAFMEQDGSVKVGIDDFLQHITGPITRVDMKLPGERIRKGEQLCTIIQKGKQLRIYAPVSGVIRAQNQKLSYDSSLINQSPFKEGWVYSIEPSNWLREISFMNMADKYRLWLKGEFSRVRDFLATTLQAGNAEMAYVTLQDGGEMKDHVLADLGPEVWEEFQRKIIDAA